MKLLKIELIFLKGHGVMYIVNNSIYNFISGPISTGLRTLTISSF